MTRFDKRYVEGKTIARVVTERLERDPDGGKCTNINRLEFTDGSALSFMVEEHFDGHYYIVKPLYFTAKERHAAQC